MQRESQIEKAVCKHAKAFGFYCRKFKSPGASGVPDHFFITPGGLNFLIEFKDPKGVVGPLQKFEIDQIQKRKGVVYVVDSEIKGKRLIDSLNAF